MENQWIDERIKSYLASSMVPAERLAFEAELKQSTALQKAYLQRTLLAPTQSPDARTDERLRALAEEVVDSHGPLPEPSVTFADRLRFRLEAWFDLRPSSPGPLPPLAIWWRSPLRIAGAAVVLFLIAWAVWPTRNVARVPPDVLKAYILEPMPFEIAGAGDFPGDLEVFQRASDFYFGIRPGGLDSLTSLAATCPDFCMAHFYVAHWHLGHGQYALARQELEQCLAHASYLKRFRQTSDINRVRFNWMVARLGAGEAPDQVKPDLDRLVEDQETGKDLRNLVRQLRQKLG